MSIMSQRLAAAMSKWFNVAGTQIRVQQFTSSVGSVYDDDITWSQTGGDTWTSGIILPLSRTQNSSDAILLEQGKLIEGDKRLYVHGSLVFTGSEFTVSIRIGSPAVEVDKQYTMIAQSKRYDVSNVPIYKQVYIRQIGVTGSLLGV